VPTLAQEPKHATGPAAPGNLFYLNKSYLNIYMNLKNLTPVENVEYYLGKDTLPNLHWQARIPATWEIPPKVSGMALVNTQSYNTTITLSENIPYKLNNLGYRSNFDYDVETLSKKQIILVLGDSDTFARGVDLEHSYSTFMQDKLNELVINMGVPGLSPDGVARIGVQTMLALGSAIKHVCILWPGFSLREFVSKTFCSGTHNQGDHVPYTDWYKHIDWVNNNYNYQKNKILLSSTAASINAQFHELMINHNDKNNRITFKQVKSGELAFSELDETAHQAIANYFVRKINSQPSLFQELTQS
jgi:hypothetical protein